MPAPRPISSPPPDFVAVERQPEFLVRIDPEYPDLLRRAGIEGRVVVRAWIGLDGRVRDVRLVQSDHEGFNAATLAAVFRWRFRPAEQAGAPVEVWMPIPVRFRLPPKAGTPNDRPRTRVVNPP